MVLSSAKPVSITTPDIPALSSRLGADRANRSVRPCLRARRQGLALLLVSSATSIGVIASVVARLL
jgi:hypothetical protein